MLPARGFSRFLVVRGFLLFDSDSIPRCGPFTRTDRLLKELHHGLSHYFLRRD